MRLFALVLLAACGGKSTPAESTLDQPAPAVEVFTGPACAPAGPIALSSSGKLACRELPIEVEFPPGTELTRQNDRALTLYSAKLDKGVMALVVEPRTDAPDGPRIEALLHSLVKGIAADATASPATAPALAGASASAALTFTTPDGGAGIARGYFANHWLFAVIVGARAPSSPSRPDQPAAQRFLRSLAIRPLATGVQKHALAEGGSVELPASAWSTGTQPPQDGVRSEVIYVAPEGGAWLGVRELERRDRCDYLGAAVPGPTDDIAQRLETIYANAQHPLAKVERAKFGDLAVYAETDSTPTHVVLYLICAGKSVVQLTAAGERAPAELRAQLDVVARSLVGAP